jgi:hypothetical protein
MADFGDLKLDRPQLEATPPPPRFPSKLPIVAAAIIATALGLLWYLGRSQNDTPATSGAPPAPASDAAPPARLAAEPGDDIPLPPLDDSDPLIRELIGRLSTHPRVTAWLTTDHLVRNLTAVVVNIAEGRTPAVQLNAVKPAGAYPVVTAGGRVRVDPAGYARYDSHADAIGALDARGVARFYATIRPRIDEAYGELGAPHGSFDVTLQRAIVELLRTPVLEGDIRLRQDGLVYIYEDPALEGLSHAQRQFLRMGPRNIAIVQRKLREVAQYLGIPPQSLPAARAPAR